MCFTFYCLQGGDSNLRLSYVQYGLYYLLTCGGFTGSQDVDAAAAAFRDVAATNPKYAAAGLVELREQLLQVGVLWRGVACRAMLCCAVLRRVWGFTDSQDVAVASAAAFIWDVAASNPEVCSCWRGRVEGTAAAGGCVLLV
jgi:hypothetical protein